MEKSLISRRRRLSEEERVSAFRIAADQLRALCLAADAKRDLAVVAIGDACEARLAAGLKLLECKEAFAGEFDDWLDGFCSEWFSRASAYRWMKKVSELRAAIGAEHPTFEQLKRAMLAAELLPSPGSGEPGGHGEVPAPSFRLAFTLRGDPDQWDPAERKEFIERAKPVIELYERCQAAIAAA